MPRKNESAVTGTGNGTANGAPASRPKKRAPEKITPPPLETEPTPELEIEPVTPVLETPSKKSFLARLFGV